MQRNISSRIFAQSRRFFSDWLKISDEVREALREKKGVVALESTVITHGMPYPENLKTAKALEDIVRSHHCVPATVAVADGHVHIGLTDSLMQRLADPSGDILKVSRRDLAVALSRKEMGGTTVSATMLACKTANISVFATGGIGGVHRDVMETFDISADLTELGKTPVAVVCAGIKSILDVPKTLEYLETQGVPVITFDNSNEWPGFFTPQSGCKSAYYSTDENEIAKFIDTAKCMQLEHGFVIGVPPPGSMTEDGIRLANAVEKAIKEAQMQNVKGRHVTPFILKRVNELTEGISLKINIALIKNNAAVASRIARALAELRAENGAAEASTKKGSVSRVQPAYTHAGKVQESINEDDRSYQPDVVVIGGTIVDFYIAAKEEIEANGGTYKGVISQTCGGVGRNHADALSRLGVKTLLISAIGDDGHRHFVQSSCSHMNLSAVRIVGDAPTATYAGVTISDRLVYGIAAMDVHHGITKEWVESFHDSIATSKMVVLDGNIPVDTLRYACDLAFKNQIPIWFDPTDVRKGTKIFNANSWRKLSYLSPNLNEFISLAKGLKIQTENIEILATNIQALAEFLLKHWSEILASCETASRTLVVTCGKQGVLVASTTQNGNGSLLHYEAPISNTEAVVNVSGAGDCLNAGIIRGLLSKQSLESALDLGLQCANASLLSKHPVPPSISENRTVCHIIPKWKMLV